MMDLHGVFIMYGVFCVLGSIFVVFALQETSGKSIDGVGTTSKDNTKMPTCDKEQQIMIPVEKC